MDSTDARMLLLAKQVANMEAKLQELAWEIEEGPQFAPKDPIGRDEALRLEQSAVLRELMTLLDEDQSGNGKRLDKVRALLDYVSKPGVAIRIEAEFLSAEGPGNAAFAAKATGVFMSQVLRAIKRIVGDRDPEGVSVFVSQSHQKLAERYGLGDPPM